MAAPASNLHHHQTRTGAFPGRNAPVFFCRSDACWLFEEGEGCAVIAPPASGHFGIPVMEERARKLGGSLRVNTAVDSGTEVSVTVSFQTINYLPHQQHYIVPWIGV